MKTSRLIAAIAAIAMAVAMSAKASLYDISFSGTEVVSGYSGPGVVVGAPVEASGWINIVGTTATAGQLTVLVGPNAGVTCDLLTGVLSGSHGTSPSGEFLYDDYANPAATPVVDSTYGLTWVAGGTELNLWYDNATFSGLPNEYTLWGWNGATGYAPTADGNLSLTAAVPEPATLLSGVMVLLPFGASAMRILRRGRTA